MELELPARFWAKVNKTDTCWLWTAQVSYNGYGLVHWNGRPYRAHRLAYEAAVGLIPTGMQVDHLCHVRNCVRPSHLQLATNQANNENRRGANSNSRSGVRGVSWAAHVKRWDVRVVRRGQTHHGGYFDDLADAEAVAIALRNRLMTNNLTDRSERHGSRDLAERLRSSL